MSTGIYSIGVSGLAAAQLGLLATEHNVVNANTPGYTRQRTVQATNIAINTGAGALGQGVHVQTIERMYDRYLTAQVNSAQTTLSGIESYYTQIKQIDNLLADPSAGLTPALQDFFSGVQQVASNPSLLSARESMISSSTTLVNRFQSISLRLDEMAEEVNGKIQDAVTSVNSYASQIADLNQRIIISEGTYGQPANDLLDQRDQLINDLNKLIKVTTSTNSNGSFNVFIGTGQQLVIGNQAMIMTASASSADPGKIAVGLQTAAGGSMELPENLVTGGELGGLLSFRSQTLERATNELGRIAASVALTFNAQHALGMDLQGNANGSAGFNADYFNVANFTPTVSANTHNSGNLLVTSQLIDPPPFGTELNDGNFYTNLTTSDYRLVFNGGTSYTLTRLSDNTNFALTATPPGTLTQASEGISITLGTGAATAGDSYLIQPTQNAAKNISLNPVIAADARAIAAAVPFRTSATATNLGTGAISAGKTVPGFSTDPGFNVANLASNITVTFSGTPAAGTLSFAGLPATAQIIVKLPGQPESTTAAVPPIAYQQGMTVSVAGMSFTFTGQPVANDTFTLARNTAATADGRNALALGQLQTKNTMSGAKATFQGAYAEMVASNGIKTRELKVTGEAQQAVLDQAQASRDALSGVNLDEEAANMIRFQQAYQASAKLLEVGKTLFDTVLQLG